MDSGNWDAIHLVTTNIDVNNKAKYRLVSAVFLHINATNDSQGKMDISNQVNKTREQIYNLDQSIDGADLQQFHIRNIGNLIENTEAEIRAEMHGITLTKSNQIVDNARLNMQFDMRNERSELQKELIEIMRVYDR